MSSDDDAPAPDDASVGTGGGTDGSGDVTDENVEVAKKDTKDAREKVIEETVKARVLKNEKARLEKKAKTGTITSQEKKRLKQLPKEITKAEAKVKEAKTNLKEKQKIEAELKQQLKNQKTGGTILAPVNSSGTDGDLNKRGQKSGGSGESPSGMPFPGPHDWDGLGSMAVVRKLEELGYNYDKTQTAGGWWKKLPRMHPMRVTYRNFWKSVKKRHPRLGRKKRLRVRRAPTPLQKASSVDGWKGPQDINPGYSAPKSWPEPERRQWAADQDKLNRGEMSREDWVKKYKTWEDE
mgnify:CR=1 FL=1